MNDSWTLKNVIRCTLTPEDAKSWDAKYITITTGLHKIGDQKPYFSTTATIHKYDNENNDRGFRSGGCLHDEILKYRPDLAPLIALHLSDEDGVPMHGEANGWYWLAGALGGRGEIYHGGNGTDAKSPDECLRIFAKHCRITVPAATDVGNVVGMFYASRAMWGHICDAMKPRWSREAEAGIEMLRNLAVPV